MVHAGSIVREPGKTIGNAVQNTSTVISSDFSFSSLIDVCHSRLFLGSCNHRLLEAKKKVVHLVPLRDFD